MNETTVTPIPDNIPYPTPLKSAKSTPPFPVGCLPPVLREMVELISETVQVILHIGRSSVYKLFSSDGFPSIKMGGILRVEKSKFEKWLNTYSGRTYTM